VVSTSQPDPTRDRLKSICADRQDAIVIGAGVGGAATAIHLARRLGRSRRVLLVERSTWPRVKVCGCCLNNAAVNSLEQLGIAKSLLASIGSRLSRVHVRCGDRAAEWPIPEGIAIPRSTLDNLLVEAAVSAGAVFIPECSAAIIPDAFHPTPRVQLQTASESAICSTRQVFVADGLAGSALAALPSFRPLVQLLPGIGLGGIVEQDLPVPSGVICMNIGAHGYVGLVRLSDGSTNLAAAIDPVWIKERGGPESAVASILQSCGVQGADPARRCKLKGTGFLTRRRRRVSAPGIFVLGDSAAYTAPFTGEGMAWALASAEAAADIGVHALLDGSPGTVRAWQHWHDTAMRGRQRTSRMVRAITHSPLAARTILSLLNARPGLDCIAASITRRLSAPLAAERAL
jgi:flavin-dependent dehydrogenase